MFCKGRVTLSLALLALLASPRAFAATAALVTDLNPQTIDTSLVDVPQDFHALGSKVVFVAGNQLWGSDGTAAGTGLLHDFGSCGHFGMRLLGVVRGRAIFNCVNLWSTDGTAAGTQAMGAPFPDITSDAQNFAVTAAALYYTNCDSTHCSLYRSDGTVAGTKVLSANLAEAGGVTPHDMTAVGGQIFFVAETPFGRQLWRSDGTTAGTAILETSAARLSQLTSAGLRLFFFADDGQKTGLWVSDGSTANTRQLITLKTAEPFAGTTVKVLGATFYFVADDGTHGPEIWASDATVTGTRPITDLPFAHPFSEGLRATQIEQVGGRILFVVSDGVHAPALWTSGGTPATTAALAGCPGGCPGSVSGTVFVRAGNRLVFADARESLWSTDGTGAGTLRLKTNSDLIGLVPLAGEAYFAATDATGTAVWKTDGSRTGTVRLGGPTSFFSDDSFVAVAAGGKVFFPGAGGNAFQLWATDGTPAGTLPLTAFGDEGASSFPSSLTAFGNEVLFTAFDGTQTSIFGSGGTAATTATLVAPGTTALLVPQFTPLPGGRAVFLAPDSGNSAQEQVWETDGTAAGTHALTHFTNASPLAVVAYLGRALFAVEPDSGPTAFWTSDGTPAGTAELFELPGGITGVRALTAASGRFYFLANTGTSADDNLWVSDGTAAGTHAVTSQANSAFPADPEIVSLGSTVFFRIDADPAIGPDLWKTDGTAAGTGSVLSRPFVDPSDLLVWNGALYFFASDSTGTRRGLYRSDGSAAGTALLANVAPFRSTSSTTGATVATPAYFAPSGALFFAGTDGVHGVELWKTDGTAAGTVLVRDLLTGAAASNPTSLAASGGLVYFAANDGQHGTELWQSDGTAAGTRLVQDLAPGGASSNPAGLTVVGSELFFTADDGLTGTELWVYPLAAQAGCQPTSTALCLSAGRFQVEAVWRDFSGNSGVGQAVALTPDTGYFWFFSPSNVETVLKVLDGRALNDHFWTFYGALSSVDYMLTVTDTQTGAARRYVNPPGTLASVADTTAFGPLGANALAKLTYGPVGQPTPALVTAGRTEAAPLPCTPSSTRLCLSGGRFAVEALWTDFQGNTGVGTAVPLTGDTGYFWFFDPANVETVLKVLDGRPLNGKFWVFYGALSSVQYTLTVTDTETGTVKTYANPSGRLASVADTDAF